MSDTPRTDEVVRLAQGKIASARACDLEDIARQLERELQAALMVQRSEVADTGELIRYGIRWAGPREPIADSTLPGGYWTPWHIAQKHIARYRFLKEQCAGDDFGIWHEKDGFMKPHEVDPRIDAAMAPGNSPDSIEPK